MAKDFIPIKISTAVMRAMAQVGLNESFFQSIVQIGTGLYDCNNPICDDKQLSTLLDIINSESTAAHERRTQAGMASAVSRLGTANKSHIVIPEIIPPPFMKARTIGGVDFSPKTIAQIRYVMLVRNYGISETDIFIRDTLKRFDLKLPNEELVARAMSWDNFNRGCRFPQCPEFHKYFLKLLSVVSPQELGYLVDTSVNVVADEHDVQISCTREVYDIMKKEQALAEEFKTCYPSHTITFRKTTFR